MVLNRFIKLLVGKNSVYTKETNKNSKLYLETKFKGCLMGKCK